MAGRRTEPKSIEARYEQLTGGLGQRRVIYLVRRRLGFTRKKWNKLDPHTQRIYVEGLLDEFADRGSSSDRQGVRDAHNIPLSEFAAAGARVRRI